MKYFSKFYFCFSKILIVSTVLFVSCNSNNTNTLIDLDGNVYSTVRIGTQVWMAENLKVTQYNNGDRIPNIVNDNDWSKTTIGAYCNYNNDSTLVSVYGRLYNWYVLNDSRKIAPMGWHIPSIEEINTLITYLGGDTLAGIYMKESGTVHWLFSNDGATNMSGFSALPGGYRYDKGGSFHTMGSNGYWWSKKESYELFSWSNRIYSSFANIDRNGSNKNLGLSVRCIKD